MGKLVFVADNKLWKHEDGKLIEMPVYRVEKFKENVREISKRNEWKSSGSGAKFMGTATMPQVTDDKIASQAKVIGVTNAADRLIYSVRLDQVSGLYFKSYDISDNEENLIISNQNIYIEGIDFKNNKLAACMGFNNSEKHIATFNLPSAAYVEHTDGDTVEESPCWSKTSNELFFTTAGYARDENGMIAAVSPRSIASYNFDSEEMSTVIESEDYDYLKPKSDYNGNLYCIKCPYNESKTNQNIFIDLLLFPIRIIKAILGFLNVFSMLFGGESLRSGGQNASKAKQKSEKDMFIDGNMVNVEKTQKENENRGEKYPGIVPKSWQLIKISKAGGESVIKCGILDYTISDSNAIIVSNGNHIVEISDTGEETLICKAKMAVSLSETDY